MVDWKTVHYLSYVAVLLFALEPSYIHPDEHFQSLEVLTAKFYNYSVNTPWEFNDPPSRSYAVLYLVYGPLLWINKHVMGLSGLPLLYLFRLQFAFTFIVVVQVTFSLLCKTKQESSKSKFFLFTSYVTWTYQSHTFSNSIETNLLLIALSLVHVIRASQIAPSAKASCILGALVSIGVFNRITFLCFLILPALTVMKKYLHNPLSLLTLMASFLITSYALVVVDTHLFNTETYTITPLNNLIYNSSYDNLATHGIHPRYTHLLVNIPQLLGPVLLPFFFRNHYKTSTPYLSIFSGLIFLSLVPHQELRFLIPLVPLVCVCIDLTNFENPDMVDLLMKVWCIFNLIMGLLMGSGHQRGVLKSLQHLKDIGYEGSQIWWKTYTPPTWVLGYDDLVVSRTVEHFEKNLVFDLMGADLELLVKSVNKLNETLLITPRSSVPLLERINGTEVNLEKVWSYNFHLDLDHFDVGDIRTFYPGIDIYKATSLL